MFVIYFISRCWLVPSRLRVTGAKGAGGDPLRHEGETERDDFWRVSSRWMKRSKHGLFVFPQKTPNMEKALFDWSIVLQYNVKRSIDWFLESSWAWSFFIRNLRSGVILFFFGFFASLAREGKKPSSRKRHKGLMGRGHDLRLFHPRFA